MFTARSFKQTVSLHSAEGRRLLHEASDRVPLAHRYFESQCGKKLCSVASSVIALNALSGRTAYSQEQFFTSSISATCQRETVERNGMTLRELGTALSLHGAEVSVEHADEGSVAEFRKVADQGLRHNRAFMIVNYHRAGLGQRGGGHFSPVAAYHRASDRVLVLDVAEIRYPPVWVTTPSLFAAMASFDPMARRSRGYAVVRR